MNFPLCSFLVWVFCALCSGCVNHKNSLKDIPSTFTQTKTHQPLVTDSFKEKLNELILNELVKRAPRDKQYIILDKPVMAPWHRLTDMISCQIQLNETKCRDPQEALTIYTLYAQAYIDTLNNVREIRPYITSFPYSLDMWDFVVDFARDKKTQMFFYAPFISGVECFSNKIIIHQLLREKQLPDGQICYDIYENIFKTPNILPKEIQNMDLPKFDKTNKPKKIPSTTKFCSFNDGLKEEFTFAQNLAKKNGLILIALEGVLNGETAHSPKNDCLQEAFATQEKCATLNESKELVRNLRDSMISFLVKGSRLSNWANLFRKQGKESLSPTINLQEYMSFRVSFWDEYIDRVKAPHIAEIRVVGQKARYYIADELQRLQLVHEEELPPHTIEIPVPKELLKEKPKEHSTS